MMKISDASGNVVSGLNPAAGLKGGKVRGAAEPAAGDRAQLSQLSAHLSQGVSQELLNKVSQLAATVTSGQYRVDANAVSAGIIRYSMVFDGTAAG
jgi:anti-sigma28 factor (negative regulator of flagellin synthesis)